MPVGRNRGVNLGSLIHLLTLSYILSKVKDKLNGRFLAVNHIVIDINIDFQLSAFSDDQFAALRECFFHKIMRRMQHRTPKRVLNADFRYTN